jgi:hypothetical protein
MRLMGFLNRLPRPLLVGGGVALIGLLGALDYLTGWEFSFSIFYLLPVCLVTLGAGRWPGLGLSLASGVVWLAVEASTNPHYTYRLAPYWNALVRLGFFVIVTLMLDSLREAWRYEKEAADVIRPLYEDSTAWKQTDVRRPG